MSLTTPLESMRESYRCLLRTEPLFCKGCATVLPHRVLSRTPITGREVLAPRTAVLCECTHCRGVQMLAAQEFASWAPICPDSFCKVLGRGHLLAGDWVYVPGRPRPGRVKAVFRAQGQERIVITYEDGTEERVARTLHSAEVIPTGDSKLVGYRLLPFQVAQTRIGDSIYHVHRESFGTAVGFQFGRESKLVIQLESGVLLFIALPPELQIADNVGLTAFVREQLHTSCPNLPSSLEINAAQGMAYLMGSVPDLATLHLVINQCHTMPGLRAVVDAVLVEPREPQTDAALENRVHELLASKSIPLIRGVVHCENGYLTIRGYYRKPGIPSELRGLLEREPLRGLDLDLSYRPTEDPADKIRSQAVNQALRKHTRLQGARIRANALDGVVFLEGVVSSTLQKNQATLAAMIAGRNLKVENHLRVVRPVPN